MNKIDSFSKEFRFLSNFFPVEVELDGEKYPSVEHAYQAAKTLNLEARKKFRMNTAANAKSNGKKLELREDWDDIKLTVMENLVRQKFQRLDLKEALSITTGYELIEGNYWHDNFFGSCTCFKCNNIGQNQLGKILMKIREELL